MLLMGVETWGADELVQGKHVYEREEAPRVADGAALGFQCPPHTCGQWRKELRKDRPGGVMVRQER